MGQHLRHPRIIVAIAAAAGVMFGALECFAGSILAYTTRSAASLPLTKLRTPQKLDVGGAISLGFQTKTANAVVKITYSALCSIDNQLKVPVVSIWIEVDGVAALPSDPAGNLF